MNISPHLALASWGFILLLVMAAKRLGLARQAQPRHIHKKEN
jgi:hypothetical protein